MMDPWESLKVNQARGLLAGVFVADVQGGAFFDVYDVKEDCAHPKLLASVAINGLGHEGEWSPDGKTYYATGVSSMVTAIDVTDPTTPKPVTAFFPPSAIHGLGVSEDGNRVYLAHMNADVLLALVDGSPNRTATNGLGIWDVSTIQSRAVVPQAHLLGTALWSDGEAGQHAIPITSGGRPYVIFVDELRRGGARIIDIGDERQPRVIAKLKTEIQMPDQLATANADTRRPPDENHGRVPGSFGYDAHYCSTDRTHDPTVLACSEFQSGLRVFDIHDVNHPREIAYYNPGGDGHAAPGSFGGTYSGYTSAQPRIVPERGEIWFTDQDRGFYVVHFASGAWPAFGRHDRSTGASIRSPAALPQVEARRRDRKDPERQHAAGRQVPKSG
jgi:hypothetical protein